MLVTVLDPFTDIITTYYVFTDVDVLETFKLLRRLLELEIMIDTRALYHYPVMDTINALYDSKDSELKQECLKLTKYYCINLSDGNDSPLEIAYMLKEDLIYSFTQERVIASVKSI